MTIVKRRAKGTLEYRQRQRQAQSHNHTKNEKDQDFVSNTCDTRIKICKEVYKNKGLQD